MAEERQKIPVLQGILKTNDQLAEENARRFDDLGSAAVNIMSAPGSGKTSLILHAIDSLGSSQRVGVIESDVAS